MRVHIIEADSQFSGVMARFLEKNECEVTRSGFSDKRIVQDADALVYELDAQLDSALQHLEKIIRDHPEIPVVVTTDADDVKIGVGVIKAGAVDCLVKPFLPDQLKQALATAATRRKKREVLEQEDLKEVQKEVEPAVLKKEVIPMDDFLWTQGTGFLRAQTELVTRNKDTVFIYGETGSGKERLARYVHEQSCLEDGPFIVVAGAALNAQRYNELTQQAKSGTLFIDKIEDVQRDVLPSLLRTSCNNTRLIFSSTHSIETLAQKGQIDSTLFDGIEYNSIYLPPLRKRSGDILALAHHFSAEACTELGKEKMLFSEDAERAFLSYEWPGNLRELRNVVNRMALLGSEGEAWRIAYFNFRKNGAAQMEPEKKTETKAAINLREVSAKAEMDFILRMLEKVKFNKSAAARLMNISRRTLYNKLRIS